MPSKEEEFLTEVIQVRVSKAEKEKLTTLADKANPFGNSGKNLSPFCRSHLIKLIKTKK